MNSYIAMGEDWDSSTPLLNLNNDVDSWISHGDALLLFYRPRRFIEKLTYVRQSSTVKRRRRTKDERIFSFFDYIIIFFMFSTTP